MNLLAELRPRREGPTLEILSRLRKESRCVAVEGNAIRPCRNKDTVLEVQTCSFLGRKTSSRNLLGIHAVPLYRVVLLNHQNSIMKRIKGRPKVPPCW